MTGALTALQLSASPAPPQQEDSLAQVLVLDESMLFTCAHTRARTHTVETKTMLVSPFHSHSLQFGSTRAADEVADYKCKGNNCSKYMI